MYIQKLNKYNNKLCNFSGGAESSKREPTPFDNNSEWVEIKIDNKINDDKFTIYKKKCSDDKDKPILFAMAGFSHKSFYQSSQVILDKISVLDKKYREVYFINLSSIKDLQTSRVREQNTDLEKRNNLDKRSIEYQETKNKPELNLTREIAEQINRIIVEELQLDNVHLLGKSSGGGVVINLINLDKRYTGLFVSVPMWPYNVTQLTDETLKRVKFRFGWNIDDEYNIFDWKDEKLKYSYQEKANYDQIMANFTKEKKDFKIDYMSIMFHPDSEIPPDRKDHGHEIHHKLIDFFTLL